MDEELSINWQMILINKYQPHSIVMHSYNKTSRFLVDKDMKHMYGGINDLDLISILQYVTCFSRSAVFTPFS